MPWIDTLLIGGAVLSSLLIAVLVLCLIKKRGIILSEAFISHLERRKATLQGTIYLAMASIILFAVVELAEHFLQMNSMVISLGKMTVLMLNITIQLVAIDIVRRGRSGA